MSHNITIEEIEHYWQNNTINYAIFTDKTMHYGFWYDNTKSSEEAHENTNEFVIEKLGIRSEDKVLDAGCGVGGLSLLMAEKYNADVTGITISEYQINLANSYAKMSSASTRLRFLKRSYLDTEFEDSSFDKVVGLESTCYAPDKKDFVSEAYRVLKPGGKLLMMDAFQVRSEMTKKEQNHFQTFLKGWALPNLAHLEVLKQNFAEIGFKNIEYYDTTELIKKTIKTVYYNALVAYPITWLLTKLKMVDPSVHGTAKAGLAQKYIIKDGTTVYGCIVGEK